MRSFAHFARIVLTFAALMLCAPTRAEVTQLPLPPSLSKSKTFKVTAGGKRIWTEHFRTSMDIATLPEWFTKGMYTAGQQEVHIAEFVTDGPAEVVVTVPKKITRAAVRPVSRKYATRIEGNRVFFTIPGPDKLYIEIDDLPALCLFAVPAPLPAPEASANVKVFKRGVHRPGYIDLKEGDTVYLAPGALVYGGLRANGAKNIHVYGGGILDGGFVHEEMVKLVDSENITIEGITLRNGVGWTNTLVHCKGVHYRGVKVISFGPSGDGINPLNSEDVSISDSFFRCTDDCIAIKAPDYRYPVEHIRIFNNTLVGFAYADGVTIGYETNGPSISDIEVYNCDVILARGGSRVDGHSGFSIVCDGPSRIHDVLFRDLRVEQVEFKLFELIVTNGKLYGEDKPGSIEDVTIRNVSWLKSAPISLQGFSPSNGINTVMFEHCTVGEQPLASTEDPIFRIGPHVHDVTVKP